MGAKQLSQRTTKSANHPKKDNNAVESENYPASLETLDTCLPVPCFAFATACSVVGVAAFLCYWHSINGEFVFDDSEAIINNNDLKSETPLFDLFKHDFWGSELATKESHKSYRPLTVLSFRWNFWLAGGLHPWSFHGVNILLHVLVSILSLKVFTILFSDGDVIKEKKFACPRASFLCSLLFAVHPIHTESVAGIVGRADLLSALCFFASFILFYKSSSGDKEPSSSLPSLLGCIVLAAVAMLFKEQGITVLGFCIVYDLLVICKFNPVASLLKTFYRTNHEKVDFYWPSGFLLRQILLWLSGISIMVIRWQVMGSSPPQFTVADNPASFEKSWLIRVINYNYIYSLNLWILVNPWWLCFDWSMGCVTLITDLKDPRILAPVAMWIILLGLLWKAFCSVESCSHKRFISISLALLVVPFLPASNLLFRVGFVIAERVLYLSSAGYSMLFVLGLMLLCQISPLRKIVKFLLWPFVLLLAIRSFQRSSEWLTEASLFISGEAVCPMNAKVHYNIGKIKSEQSDDELALKYYREAVRLHPKYDQALNNLGNLLKDLGQLEEAETMLERAVGARATFDAGWMNLGIVKAALNKTKDAEKCYYLAIKHRRKYPDAYFNLGNLYIQIKQLDAAKAAFDKAHELKPDHTSAWLNHMLLLENSGSYEDAINVAMKALKVLPSNAGIYGQLGSIYGKMNKYQESEKYFLQAVSISPQSGNFLGNLGVLYHRWGKKDKAEKYYRQALQLDPNNANARDNLRMLLKKKTKSN